MRRFNGVADNGKTYAFFSVARDRTGNLEDPPSEPDTITRVSVLPDLTETAVSNPPPALVVAEKFSATDTVRNDGAAAGASSTRYYFSADQTKGTGDKRLGGARAIPALGADQSNTGAANVKVPKALETGSYFLLACADDRHAINEGDELNNCIASSSPVVVKAPDLVEVSVSDPPATAAKGSSFDVSDTVSNAGNAAALASTTRFFMSLDGKKNASDTALSGQRTVAALLPGAASPATTAVTVPLAIASGKYYVLVCADANKKVIESNATGTGEKNNCLASLGRVTIP